MKIYDEKRNKELDFIRGIGIILVVCGHIGLIRRFAYLFHVPLFFFASGYFFRRESFSQSVIKGIKRYYFPFVMAELIFMLFHNSLANIIGYETFTLKDIQVLIPKVLCFQNVCARLGQLWFLLALFSVSILYFLLSTIFNSYVRFCILGVMVVLHYLLYSKTNVFEFEVCALYEILLIMTVIYEIGVVFKRYEKYLINFISFRGGVPCITDVTYFYPNSFYSI